MPGCKTLPRNAEFTRSYLSLEWQRDGDNPKSKTPCKKEPIGVFARSVGWVRIGTASLCVCFWGRNHVTLKRVSCSHDLAKRE